MVGEVFGPWRSGLPRDDHAAGEGELRHRLEPIREVADVEELTAYLRFRMLHAHVTGLLQAGADAGMVEQMIVAPPRHKAQTSVLDTCER